MILIIPLPSFPSFSIFSGTRINFRKEEGGKGGEGGEQDERGGERGGAESRNARLKLRGRDDVALPT